MADTPSPLAVWESFYLLIGTAAAALTGLQFVVIAFIGQERAEAAVGLREETLAAFGTPTVVHFGSALLLSALLSAPWPSLEAAGLTVALTGLAGLVYAAIVVRRTRRQRGYRPVLEDWIWHAILPVVAYLMAVVAGLSTVRHHPEAGMFSLAAGTLLLLFIGIHNAWDTASYVAVQRTRERQPQPMPGESDAPAA